jgi:hypothetical protein
VNSYFIQYIKISLKWIKGLNMLAKIYRNKTKQTTTSKNSWAPVAHTCNPSYSGGRDQEHQCSKPAGANSS